MLERMVLREMLVSPDLLDLLVPLDLRFYIFVYLKDIKALIGGLLVAGLQESQASMVRMVHLIDFVLYSVRAPLETLAPRDLADPVDLL